MHHHVLAQHRVGSHAPHLTGAHSYPNHLLHPLLCCRPHIPNHRRINMSAQACAGTPAQAADTKVCAVLAHPMLFCFYSSMLACCGVTWLCSMGRRGAPAWHVAQVVSHGCGPYPAMSDWQPTGVHAAALITPMRTITLCCPTALVACCVLRAVCTRSLACLRCLPGWMRRHRLWPRSLRCQP